MTRKTTSYTNRQGNVVEIVRDETGALLSVEVSGTGSHRAFQAQLKAARAKATA